MESLINVPVTLLMEGTTSDNFVVYSNGSVAQFSLTASAAGTGVVSVTVTPSGTGFMQVADLTNSTVSEIVNVVNTLSSSTLNQLLGGVLGSFLWDKAANTLTLYSTSGNVLATYSITDQPTIFSRELLPS